MLSETLLPFFDLIGMGGFLLAIAYGVRNYRLSTVERTFWLAFTMTAVIGAVWLGLVSLEWFGIWSVLLDRFSTTLQAVVIGLYALSVVGTYVIVQELRGAKFEIQKRASLVSILSRILRHNIRNDITVIRGHVQTDGGNEVVEAKIDKLLSTSEKARQLEQTIHVQQHARTVNVGTIIQEVVEDITETHPDCSIDVQIDGAREVLVAPSIQTGLNEVVENAAIHTGPSPEIVIEVAPSATTVSFSVSDRGRGIPDHELRTLAGEDETPLLHSSGIGLWMTQWVVSSQGGCIDASVTDEGTTISMSLPRNGDGIPQPENSDILRVPGGRYHAIFQHGIEVCIVFDDEGRVLDANDGAAAFCGIESRELLGRLISDVIPANVNLERSDFEMQHHERSHGRIVRSSKVGGISYSVVRDVVYGEHLFLGFKRE